MKLLLGQPNKRRGYTTVDIYGTPDIVHDLNIPLDLPAASIEAIEGYHVFEHIKRPNVESVVANWHSLLVTGGSLTLEMPDARTCMELYLKTGDSLLLAYLYGNQEREGQYHYWAWDKEQLVQVFHLFQVRFTDPQDYHAEQAPCLRLEATK